MNTFQTWAGKVKPADKDPSQMSLAELQKEHKLLSLHSSAISKQMIAEGRGHERPTETLTKSDPLSQAYKAVSARLGALSAQHQVNYKNGAYYRTNARGTITKHAADSSMPLYLNSDYFEGDGPQPVRMRTIL
jgi:hypothetical protein